MSGNDKHKLNTILDKLTLESLSLMEQHIRTKIELEKCMIDGEAHLAKARYIMGHKQVSSLQLPSDNSAEFRAMSVINRDADNKDVIKDRCFDLEFRTASSQSKKTEDSEVVNPIMWFGVLVAQSLHFAQDKFKQSIHWAVQSANVQRRLSDCLNTIGKLSRQIDV